MSGRQCEELRSGGRPHESASMSSYGFLLGFGLGWLPSGIAAALAGFTMRFLWPLAAILLGLAVLGLVATMFGWIS